MSTKAPLHTNEEVFALSTSDLLQRRVSTQGMGRTQSALRQTGVAASKQSSRTGQNETSTVKTMHIVCTYVIEGVRTGMLQKPARCTADHFVPAKKLVTEDHYNLHLVYS